MDNETTTAPAAVQPEVPKQVPVPEQAETSATIGAIAGALAKAQGEIGHAGKDRAAKIKMKNGGEYGYSYATLAAVHDACREPLAKNGLSFTQLASAAGRQVRIVTILMHSSGEWIRSSLRMAADEDDPKRLGAYLTYARRYALSAMLGIASADEDDEEQVRPPRDDSPRNGGPRTTPPPAQTQRITPPPSTRPQASGPRTLTPAESAVFDGPLAAPRQREPGEDDEPPLTEAECTAAIAKAKIPADLEGIRADVRAITKGDPKHALVKLYRDREKQLAAKQEAA